MKEDLRKLYPDRSYAVKPQPEPVGSGGRLHRTREENRIRLFAKYSAFLSEPDRAWSELEFRALKSAMTWRLDEPRQAELMKLFNTALERDNGLRMDFEWWTKARGWLFNLAQLSGRGKAKPTAERHLLGEREIAILQGWDEIKIIALRHRVSPVTGKVLGWETVYRVTGKAKTVDPATRTEVSEAGETVYRVRSVNGNCFDYVVGELGHRFQIVG